MKLTLLSGIIPSLVEELLYATERNFTGKVVYPPSARAYLLQPAAEKLKRVQEKLRQKGLGLKIFDGYRPLSAQKIFWSLVPDPRYVADPKLGSKHNRGMAVDLTLVDSRGRELEMPSSFDDFSERASHSFQGCSEVAKKHRSILKEAMVSAGFIPWEAEWWHYDAPGWESCPILDVSFEELL